MESIVFQNYDDFGHEKSKLSHLRGSFRVDTSAGRSQYIPHYNARSHIPPTLNAILESRTRVYLRPTEKQKTMELNTSDPSTDFFGEEKEESLHLDLGLEPLKRVLFDMKKINTEHISYNFDPNAARESGLPRYCHYLRDTSVKMRKHRGTDQKILGHSKESQFIR